MTEYYSNQVGPTTNVTWESIQAAAEKMRSMPKFDGPDVIVMSSSMWRAVKAVLPPDRSPVVGLINHAWGIPIEHAETADELIKLMQTLTHQGKRVEFYTGRALHQFPFTEFGDVE